ncbi:MAG: hypothetical protein JKY49_03545 [Cohaesibacteraceae bacterium]|nr:hypothetical protein [Cohaesibacteraceae bacterium]MBL4876301.1 hypothetical protein [Cohaesibacteraceae bacterium]
MGNYHSCKFLVLAVAIMFSSPAIAQSSSASTIKQVAVYHKTSSQELYDIIVDADKHTAATHPASGNVKYIDPATGKSHAKAQVGFDLNAFFLPDGTPGLVARVLEIQPGKRIVFSWINVAWQIANTPSDITTMPSIVVLEFKDNTVGAEVIMTQVDVPAYQIHMARSPFSENGETAPLSEIVRVHWELAYWQPIRKYLEVVHNN